jgi:hypothetical protein
MVAVNPNRCVAWENRGVFWNDLCHKVSNSSARLQMLKIELESWRSYIRFLAENVFAHLANSRERKFLVKAGNF